MALRSGAAAAAAAAAWVAAGAASAAAGRRSADHRRQSPGRSSSRCCSSANGRCDQAERAAACSPFEPMASTLTPSGRASSSSTPLTTCRSTRSGEQARPWNHRVIADQIRRAPAGPCRAGRSARGPVRTGPIRPVGRGPDDQRVLGRPPRLACHRGGGLVRLGHAMAVSLAAF